MILSAIVIEDCLAVEKEAPSAHATFRPDFSVFKGKTVKKTPKAIMQDSTAAASELVQKNSDVVLCMDIVCVNGIGFLMSIRHPTCHQKTAPTIDGQKGDHV